MTRWERRQLSRLPERVPVFRGGITGGERGWSWTLHRDVAADFAVRYEDDDTALTPAVWSTHVDRSAIIALLSGGDEEEVILSP